MFFKNLISVLVKVTIRDEVYIFRMKYNLATSAT